MGINKSPTSCCSDLNRLSPRVCTKAKHARQSLATSFIVTMVGCEDALLLHIGVSKQTYSIQCDKVGSQRSYIHSGQQ